MTQFLGHRRTETDRQTVGARARAPAVSDQASRATVADDCVTPAFVGNTHTTDRNALFGNEREIVALKLLHIKYIKT